MSQVRAAVWFCALLLVVPGQADEVKVRASLAAYLDAFNQQQLDKVSEYWSPAATHIDRATGERTEGRDAIVADIQEAFASNAPPRIAGEITHVRVLSPTIALVHGTTSILSTTSEPVRSNFSAVMTAAGDRWQFDSVDESPLPSPTMPSEALQSLEWLIGSWVDTSDSMRVDTTFRWSSRQAFLIRSFAVTTWEDSEERTHEGTQIIGWDPRTEQIRSWKFESDGSFGEAIWSQSGADWFVKSNEVMSDGRTASGTYVLTPDGSDQMVVKLIGHEIDGEPRPAQPPVTMVRVPEDSTKQPAESK
jgi:uncharacterized protein (TIGR02246 family)